MTQPETEHDMPSSRSGWVLLAAALTMAGCGGETPPKTYPVQGRVVLSAGSIEQLAGGSIEFRLESDPTIRAFGAIQDDGTFSLNTLFRSMELSGAPEGNYRARVVLQGDDDQAVKRLSFDPSFLNFETANLNFALPGTGDVVVKLLPRGTRAKPIRKSEE
jgi:hypothetical protein